MIKENLIMAVCNDVSGQTRGKCFPAAELESRLKRGVGWVPTNVQITCFNSIAESPYGSVGDLLLIPDESTEVFVDFDDGSPSEHFFIGDILHLDGTPWECCTRSLAKRALSRLEEETGLLLLFAFEQEFQYTGAKADHWIGFGTGEYRRSAKFAETFVAALRAANLVPESFLPEFGQSQLECTLSPAVGIRAADECVIFREMARATAFRLGEKVSFSPLVFPQSVGNGVHIHFSFLNKNREPVGYDPTSPIEIGELAGQFCSGILRYMPAISALTAASVPSYLRLTPHRWSAAFNSLAVRDREAGLRICPINKIAGGEASAQFNVEYRAADASASPYLQLAAIVNAGLQGIRDKLPQPQPITGDASLMTEDELRKINVRRLPASLEQALQEMESEEMIAGWFSGHFVDIYRKHKRQEIADTKNLQAEEICRRYADLY